VQVNLLANTYLRNAEELAQLIVAQRGGAIVRLRDVARMELGAEEALWSPNTIGQRGKLGPDLAGSWRNGVDYFLENIIDPTRLSGRITS
jgi:hypothetical protein